MYGKGTTLKKGERLLINGVINVYKEQGYTSFDVVAKLRGILKQKKIGHTGTLDPMAEGVLLVCMGSATKLVDMLTEGTKRYHAVMKLGVTTDTEDITGTVLSECALSDGITEDIVLETLKSFEGEYEQIPPMYSAIKKDGKKLYEYARQGIEIERKARKVEIYSISDIQIAWSEVCFDVHCSKGTYIRSLCRDVGEKLGCGATLSGLCRQSVHGYQLKDSLRLSEIETLVADEKLASHIIPMDSLLQEYQAVHIKSVYENALMNGNKLKPGSFMEKTGQKPDEIIRVYCGKTFLALYQYYADEHIYKPYKMFLDHTSC